MTAPGDSVKIAVCGLWHLGSVTAAGLASIGFEVIGFDADRHVIADLRTGKAPLFEPGLEELLAEGLASGKLSFTSDPQMIAEADLLWGTYDTPVDDNDEAQPSAVVDAMEKLLAYAKPDAIVLVSSQLPLGTTDRLAARVGRDDLSFAYSPENLRLGQAIKVFLNPGRIVVGTGDPRTRERLEPILGRICADLIWMSVRSAELSKHAINSFLALSVAFSNEIARIAEKYGADAFEVEKALKSEERIGKKAYVRPGEAFAGGTLARDLTFLSELGVGVGFDPLIIRAALASNTNHRSWPFDTLQENVPPGHGRKVAILGLAYKTGTDTLRRSCAVELAQKLSRSGYEVVAHDPAVKSLAELADPLFRLEADLPAAVAGADAVVVMTPWDDYKTLEPEEVARWVASPQGDSTIFVDQQRVLAGFGRHQAFRYFTIGVAPHAT